MPASVIKLLALTISLAILSIQAWAQPAMQNAWIDNYGPSVSRSGTQTFTNVTISNLLTANNISATNISASGNEDVTGTLRVVSGSTFGAVSATNVSITSNLSVTGNQNITGTAAITGLLTSSGGISDTGNLSVTGNTDVTGTLKITGSSQLTGAVGVGQAANTAALSVNGTVSSTDLQVSGTTEVSISTSKSFDIVGGGNTCYVISRDGVGKWGNCVNSPNSFNLKNFSTGTIIYKCDPAGCIFSSTGINTGILASNTVVVSGSLGVTGGVSMTGLATTTATGNLCIVEATGVVVSSTSLSGCLGVSDPLAKKDIRPIPYGLHELMQVDAIAYKDLRTDLGAFPGEQVGLLAYDTDRNGVHYSGLEKVMPELVTTGGDWHGHKLKAVIYERMVAVEAKAIQEQQHEIEELQAEVDELRAMNGLAPTHATLWDKIKSVFK